MTRPLSRRPPPSPREQPRPSVQGRSWCVDGPAKGFGLEQNVAAGEEVRISVLVDGEQRTALYVGIGRCDEVPPADGVGLRFRRLLDDPRPGEPLS